MIKNPVISYTFPLNSLCLQYYLLKEINTFERILKLSYPDRFSLIVERVTLVVEIIMYLLQIYQNFIFKLQELPSEILKGVSGMYQRRIKAFEKISRGFRKDFHCAQRTYL